MTTLIVNRILNKIKYLAVSFQHNKRLRRKHNDEWDEFSDKCDRREGMYDFFSTDYNKWFYPAREELVLRHEKEYNELNDSLRKRFNQKPIERESWLIS